MIAAKNSVAFATFALMMGNLISSRPNSPLMCVLDLSGLVPVYIAETVSANRKSKARF